MVSKQRAYRETLERICLTMSWATDTCESDDPLSEGGLSRSPCIVKHTHNEAMDSSDRSNSHPDIMLQPAAYSVVEHRHADDQDSRPGIVLECMYMELDT